MTDRGQAQRGRAGGQRGDARDRGALRSIEGGQAPAQDPAGRHVPFDLKAEEGLLAGVLLGHSDERGAGGHRELIERVIDMLEPERFYAEPSSTIWDCYREILAAGQPIEILTLRAKLEDRGKLALVGGDAYLGDLLDRPLIIPHLEVYAERVIQKWRLRVAIAQSRRLFAEGYGDVGDIDEWIDGAVKIFTDLRDQRPAKTEGTMIAAAADQAAARIRQIGQGPAFGLLTGFAEVDRLTGGFKAPEVTLLGAPPKTGKTTLAREISTNIASVPMVIDGKAIGRGVIWISMEMTAEEQALCWACTIAKVDLKRVESGEASPDELDAMWRALEWLKSLPIVIYGRRSIRVDEIKGLLREGKAELAKKDARPVLVIVDHLQLLFKNEPTQQGRNDAAVYGEITRKLGDVMEWARLPVVLITQLTEDDKGRLKARGSRDIEADAQNFWILEVFDDKPAPTFPLGRSTTPVEARITVRFQRKGPKGSTTLWFTPAYTLFSETLWNEGGWR